MSPNFITSVWNHVQIECQKFVFKTVIPISTHKKKRWFWLVDSPQPSPSILEPSTFSCWSIYSQFSKHLSSILEADLASFSRDLASVSWSTFKQNLWHNMPLIFLSQIPIATTGATLLRKSRSAWTMCTEIFYVFQLKNTPK